MGKSHHKLLFFNAWQPIGAGFPDQEIAVGVLIRREPIVILLPSGQLDTCRLATGAGPGPWGGESGERPCTISLNPPLLANQLQILVGIKDDFPRFMGPVKGDTGTLLQLPPCHSASIAFPGLATKRLRHRMSVVGIHRSNAFHQPMDLAPGKEASHLGEDPLHMHEKLGSLVLEGTLSITV